MATNTFRVAKNAATFLPQAEAALGFPIDVIAGHEEARLIYLGVAHVLPPSSADGMEKLIPDLEKYLVRGSGHWTQQEKPEEVSAKLIEWRRRRFG